MFAYVLLTWDPAIFINDNILTQLSKFFAWVMIPDLR